MVQSMQSLYAYGRAFEIVMVVAGLLAGLLAITAAAWLVAPGRYARWQRWRAERRYVRTGLHELELYLTEAATRPARRRPGPPGRGRWPGSGS
jgi:hypothetical protein